MSPALYRHSVWLNRLVMGFALLLLAIFAAVLTAVRLFGLAVDGAAPFTLAVLKPEIAMTVLASVAHTIGRRRATIHREVLDRRDQPL